MLQAWEGANASREAENGSVVKHSLPGFPETLELRWYLHLPQKPRAPALPHLHRFHMHNN